MILVAYHPVTIHAETTDEADALFAALSQIKGQILFVYPNSDAGSHKLIERAKTFVEARKDARIFINLEAVAYWSLLRLR